MACGGDQQNRVSCKHFGQSVDHTVWYDHLSCLLAPHRRRSSPVAHYLLEAREASKRAAAQRRGRRHASPRAPDQQQGVGERRRHQGRGIGIGFARAAPDLGFGRSKDQADMAAPRLHPACSDPARLLEGGSCMYKHQSGAARPTSVSVASG